mmetsp:Transcript_17194/g.19222  ORF Transcript_17194/g.19222 Transcript_17194/m.19222 type:complete len:106 (-) Transcript_17194:92-409(-)
MKDSDDKSQTSKLGEDEIGKIQFDEEIKNLRAKTDRRDSQHGASGMPFDAGSVESPKSSVKLRQKSKHTIESHEKNNTEKSLNSKHDSKDDSHWNEDSKNNEDEK